jgi:hypothetical protein
MQNPLRKHRRAFVKVVEGSKIYNFPIHCFVHFYSNFWRFSCSNRGTLKHFRADGAPCRARQRHAAHTPVPRRLGVHAVRIPRSRAPSRGPRTRAPQSHPRAMRLASRAPRPCPAVGLPLRLCVRASLGRRRTTARCRRYLRREASQNRLFKATPPPSRPSRSACSRALSVVRHGHHRR